MALFTDGPVCGMEDLAANDSTVLDVASTEGIDLNAKLTLAHEEIALELADMAAATELSRVVVTPALKLWSVFHTLTLVYRDAFHNQLNDRYRGRRDEYRDLAAWAQQKLRRIGLGVVCDPVPKAGPPTMSYVPGMHDETTYFAAISWVSAAGPEGAAGEWRSFTIPAGSTLSITANGAPPNATGWHVYLGDSQDHMTRQNTAPIAAGAAWLQTEPLRSDGQRPGSGQSPDYALTLPRVLQRG